MAHRYFTSNITGNYATISGSDAAHLMRVLRAKIGQEIIVCNGKGTDYAATITALQENEISLLLGDETKSIQEASVQTTVCLGMAKGEKIDFAIQKCVELGANAIIPFYSTNTVVRPKNDDKKAERYNKIAHEAAKQCGRGKLPIVETPVNYTKMLKLATASNKALFFYEAGGQAIKTVLQGNEESISIITGAEGGFTPQEVLEAEAAGCVVASLGPRILRCETAPIAALAAVMTLTDNLN